ncbi:hypothetical protein ACTAB0_24355 [Pseudomonas syringae]|uniref:hypothetical protein n=1 Tax=Pseudomonas syringae TaxID=317 RepID=UPI003F797E3B
MLAATGELNLGSWGYKTAATTVASSTDALNNTTTLERKPGGEVLRKPTDSGRKLGVTAEKLECSYDILCRLTQEASPRKLHPHSPKTPSVQRVHAFTSAIQFLRSMM